MSWYSGTLYTWFILIGILSFPSYQDLLLFSHKPHGFFLKLTAKCVPDYICGKFTLCVERTFFEYRSLLLLKYMLFPTDYLSILLCYHCGSSQFTIVCVFLFLSHTDSQLIHFWYCCEEYIFFYFGSFYATHRGLPTVNSLKPVLEFISPTCYLIKSNNVLPTAWIIWKFIVDAIDAEFS